jgi:hypothetical protein
MKRLARENSQSKADPMDSCHMILKMHHAVENQPFGLTHGMMTGYCFCRFLA